MKVGGSDYFYIAAGLAALYVVFRGVGALDSFAGGLGRFLSALTFDPESLGRSPQLTAGAKASQEQWVALGYLEVLPDGSTRITEAGEAYIAAADEEQQL